MCRIFICIRYEFKLYRLYAFRFEVSLGYNYEVLFSPEYPIIVCLFLFFYSNLFIQIQSLDARRWLF